MISIGPPDYIKTGRTFTMPLVGLLSLEKAGTLLCVLYSVLPAFEMGFFSCLPDRIIPASCHSLVFQLFEMQLEKNARLYYLTVT